MSDVTDLFEKPLKFFRQGRSFMRAFAHFVAAVAVFAVLNETVISAGVVRVERELSGIGAVAVNTVSAITGYFVISAISFLPLALAGKRNYKDFFTVTAYSLVPLAFFWIPHLLPQAIVVIWSIMLMATGTSQTMKISYKKAAVPVAVFVILVVIFSILFRNYFVVPLSRI
jgi:hypothetical protein